MTHTLTRRALCASLPALAVPAALPVAADPTPSGDELFMSLYREWLAVHRLWQAATPHLTAQEEDRWTDALATRQYAALDAMEEHRPSTREGILALLWVQWVESGPDFVVGTEGWQEQIAGPDVRMMIAVWRAITGLDGLPRRLV